MNPKKKQKEAIRQLVQYLRSELIQSHGFYGFSPERARLKYGCTTGQAKEAFEVLNKEGLLHHGYNTKSSCTNWRPTLYYPTLKAMYLRKSWRRRIHGVD